MKKMKCNLHILKVVLITAAVTGLMISCSAVKVHAADKDINISVAGSRSSALVNGVHHGYFYYQLSDEAKRIYDEALLIADRGHMLTASEAADMYDGIVNSKALRIDSIKNENSFSDAKIALARDHAENKVAAFGNLERVTVKSKNKTSQYIFYTGWGNTFILYNRGKKTYAEGIYLFKKRSEAEIDQIIEARDRLLAQVDLNATPEQIELQIHDALINWVEYDYDAYNAHLSNTKTSYDENDVYGALVNHKAVCGGYSFAFSYLMNYVGIPTMRVTGYVSNTTFSGEHAWNIVLLGSDWYEVDCTWDDQPAYMYVDELTHSYFNITTEYMNYHNRGRIDIPGSNGFFPPETTTRSRLSALSWPTAYGTRYSYKAIKSGARSSIVTVTLDVNGEGATIGQNTVSAYDGVIHNIPAPARPGYTFAGWYTEPVNGSVIEDGYRIASDTTIYARWQTGDVSVFTVGGITYEKTDDTTVCVNAVSDAGTVIIPAKVSHNGREYRVRSIGDDAFMDASGVHTIKINAAVTRIGPNAFSGACNVNKIVFSKAAKAAYVDDSAFIGIYSAKVTAKKASAHLRSAIRKNSGLKLVNK